MIYQSIRNYKIINILNQGNFGTVFKVLNENDNQIYVLKQIIIDDKDNNLKLAQNEANILKSINNENVVKYYDSFLIDNSFNIIMEYCGNYDLRKFINNYKNENKSIEVEKIISIILDICNGLEEIHRKKIIHRDLKPENLFMTIDNKVKIGDFGISKQLKNTKHFVTYGGTLNYIAPEIIQKKPFTNKIDVWSLGCILYEILELKKCFDSQFPLEICNKIIKEKHNNINFEKYNKGWQNLIDLALKKNEEERPDINKFFTIFKKMIMLNYDKLYKK